jgi:hypothetical protein
MWVLAPYGPVTWGGVLGRWCVLNEVAGLKYAAAELYGDFAACFIAGDDVAIAAALKMSGVLALGADDQVALKDLPAEQDFKNVIEARGHDPARLDPTRPLYAILNDVQKIRPRLKPRRVGTQVIFDGPPANLLDVRLLRRNTLRNIEAERLRREGGMTFRPRRSGYYGGADLYDFTTTENPLSGGGNWTNKVDPTHGNMEATGGQGKSASGVGSAWWNALQPPGDMEAWVSVPVAGTYSDLAICVQSPGTSGADWYSLSASQDQGTNAVLRWDNTGYTILNTFGGSPPNGYAYSFAKVGNDLESRIDTGGGYPMTPDDTTADSTYAGGYGGLRPADTSIRVDDFGVSTVGGGGGGTILPQMMQHHGG